jgi:hypothetical protein
MEIRSKCRKALFVVCVMSVEVPENLHFLGFDLGLAGNYQSLSPTNISRFSYCADDVVDV